VIQRENACSTAVVIARFFASALLFAVYWWAPLIE
jgi:hypothetical protein